MSKFRNVCIAVNGENESRSVQEVLFANGCEWAMGDKIPCCLTEPYISVDIDGRIVYSQIPANKNISASEFLRVSLPWTGDGLPPVGCE